ncbi:hypothetical protein ACIGDI_27225 [Streptomyces sp. NPDC085900]|uniref:hypothetical protein n=1 Tax=Streptomyces sp. NPDC085900 TaxID=3365737 RepID=UPI0037D49E1C
MNTEDRDAVVRAATLKALSGPWDAPVRLLGRHRTVAWAQRHPLFPDQHDSAPERGRHFLRAWGFLWALPVLIVDRRFAAVRKEAEAQHIAALEAALAERR